VTRLARHFGVTAAGYYAWRRRGESAHAARDRELGEEITRIFRAHGGRYGSPRIHHELQRRGIRTSRRRVARLLRAAGLQAKAVLGYRRKAGVHRFYDALPNLVHRHRVTRPDRIWVGDITYVAVAGQWRYLAVVMDQCSRRILAWSLQRRRDARVTGAVLAAAVRRRQPAPGLIFHSDRGTEYLAASYQRRLARHRMRPSANTAGPGDNAHMESFFHSLKAEALRGRTFASDGELRRVLRDYLTYYNGRRAHSALGYRSPTAFERQAA
jgi:putative transposase